MSSSQTNSKQLFKTNFAVIAFSLFVGVILMAVKFYAYKITGSSAILSDALESIINVVAGAFAMFSMWWRQNPLMKATLMVTVKSSIFPRVLKAH
jgi:divalent metal cation (Fe/Co/Zn/Cd) transporter